MAQSCVLLGTIARAEREGYCSTDLFLHRAPYYKMHVRNTFDYRYEIEGCGPVPGIAYCVVNRG
jgi:hypothetical protein